MNMTPSPIEHFGQGIRRYWLTTRVVVIETDGDMSIQAVDQWAEVVVETINGYPASEPAVFLLHNLSHPNQRITPYSRQKAQSIYSRLDTHRPVYMAVVMAHPVLIQIASVLARVWLTPKASMQQKLFVTPEAALEWLRQKEAEQG